MLIIKFREITLQQPVSLHFYIMQYILIPVKKGIIIRQSAYLQLKIQDNA